MNFFELLGRGLFAYPEYNICDTHNISFPKGAKCPKCNIARTTDTKGVCNTNSSR